MYVAVLTTQKNILEEECDKSKKDVEEGKVVLSQPLAFKSPSPDRVKRDLEEGKMVMSQSLA